MALAMKLALLILVMLASVVLYTLAFVAILLSLTGAKATGLPALVREPLYWLLLAAVLSGEVWLAVHRVRW